MISRPLSLRGIWIALSLVGLLSVSSLIAHNPLFEVTSTGDNFTEVEFNLNDYIVVPVDVDGVKYNRLYHNDAGFLMDEKLPEVIHFSFFLTVPRTGTIEIEEPSINESKIINNFNLFPSQGYDLEIDEEKGFLIDEAFYQKDLNYPDYLTQLSKPMIMRDTRLVSITLYPFAFNPARNELTVREKMTVRVNYNTSVQGENELRNPERRISRGFEKIIRGQAINYEQFRNPNIEYQPRSILIIKHHTTDVQYQNLVQQFVDWKRDKGFEVRVASTQNMNNFQAIKNYINNAYFDWDVPPEYLIIMGSGQDGILPIPHSSGDHPYSLIVGNDDLADIFVGRISVPNAMGLATIWNKIRNYERTPYTAETAWYNHNTLIGDLTSHGATITPKFLMKYLKETMLSFNPEKELSEIYAAPFPSQMEAAMNRGGLFFWYRGAIGGSGWTASESLTNGHKTPHAHYVTCSTLDYNGGRQTEPVFRVGTPTQSRGAITAIGFIGGVNTSPGNALTAGTLTGIYVDGIRTMGEGLVYSKMNLWRVYGNSHPSQATSHSRGGNLIGDPSMDIWLRVPKELNVSYPETIPAGSNSIQFTVTDDDDAPIENAWVTIRQRDENGDEIYFANGYTGSDGISTRFFPTNLEGEVTVTVTKPDYKPHLGNFEIDGDPAISYYDIVVQGDLNAGSEVNFVLVATNHKNQAMNGITGTITTTDEHITITENNATFGNFAANGNASSTTSYTIQTSPSTPANHKAIFKLTMTDNDDNSWDSRFVLTIRNGNLIPVTMNVLDEGGNGVLDPLETANIKFHIKNTGDFMIRSVRGRLTGDAYGLSVIDSTAVFGNIGPGQTVTSNTDHFGLSTSTYVIPGQIFKLNLQLYNNEGFSQNHEIEIPIGTVRVNTPLGPDNYGYWIFDDGDLGYVDTPEYEWIEIVRTNGGFQGENQNIVADFDNVQGFKTIDLPFTFKFYGIDYDQITICANGWLAFGESEQGEQRNWRLPGVLGPAKMVAAFWDNLSTSSGGVYTYYYQERNQFIVQWENTKNVMNNATNTFQIILHDPSAYYTTTFDGPIKIQYKTFNNVNNGANNPSGIGNWGNYCTVGIRDHLNKSGIEYTYNNRYPTAAKPITNETALYITTGLSSALVGIESYTFSDGNNNIPEYNEEVDINMMLQNVGIEEAFDVKAVLSTEDPHITILQNRAEYGDIDIQESVNINNAYTIRISDDVPHDYKATMTLTITAEDNLFWRYSFTFRIEAPSLVTVSPFVHDPDGNNNGLIDPGESLIMYLPIHNAGATTPPVDILVTSESEYATITQISDPHLFSIAGKETQYPAVYLDISEQASLGTGLTFNYAFETGNYSFQGQFMVGVGGIIPVQIGTGELVTGSNEPSPINIYFRSNRSQFVYTKSEFNQQGIYGEFPINQFGFYVDSAPEYPLVDFKIRLRHTAATNAANHDPDSLQIVYRVGSYRPTPGRWDLLTLERAFIWNGVDNLLVDTSFAPVQGWSHTGTIRVYEYEKGYRFARMDTPDQSDQITTDVIDTKPQAMIMMGIDAGAAANRPQNLTAESTATSINLSWQPPQGQRANNSPTRRDTDSRASSTTRNTTYNVYRNGIKLNEQPLAVTNYQDTSVEGHTPYFYYVTAIISQKESGPSNVVHLEANAVNLPDIDPPEGIYYEPILVSIIADSDDTTIYYTLDGNDPTIDDFVYEEPFEVNCNTTVKAMGVRADWLNSRIKKADYYFLYSPQNPIGYGTTNSITLTWDEPCKPDNPDLLNRNNSRTRSQESMRNTLFNRNVLGYNVYRSLDEEHFERMNESMLEDREYQERELETNIYYYYITALYEQGESHPSEIIPVGVGVVTMPVFVPESGTYHGHVELVIRSTAGPRSIVYYTLNGERPTENSLRFTGEPIFIDKTTTVRAFAIRTNWQDSEPIRGVFRILETSVEEEEVAPIVKTELLAAYPNPFNPSTTILFNLKEESSVTLEIYNIAGKKVKTLVNSNLQAGAHSIVWDGHDENKRKVSSGIYFYRMKTPDYSAVKKIVMLK